jgi:hypothetical protein
MFEVQLLCAAAIFSYAHPLSICVQMVIFPSLIGEKPRRVPKLYALSYSIAMTKFSLRP